jgi:hypothetical protein
MEETKLKKEFKRSDVQRMRNIITGKPGESTKTQIGWEKNNQIHKEGEVWEEMGKTWTIKNGIKQTVTKMDSIKRLTILPLSCPKCKKHMKIDDLNKKAYYIHNTCFDCMIEMETELKAQGKYEDYEKEHTEGAKDAFVNDLENALDAWFNSQESFINEQGDVEGWAGGDKQKIYEAAKNQLDKLRNT